MLATARRLLSDDSGATAIEYALLAGLIAAMIIAAVINVGQTLGDVFTRANDDIVRLAPAVK
ncbi:MAG TPA: Flp family type IVb pilin [Amaricoccus sp.]|jgi:pilus assembly protein Flp/PilA|nr:Flp family type IVb pilin [Amaricoccus sp.]